MESSILYLSLVMHLGRAGLADNLQHTSLQHSSSQNDTGKLVKLVEVISSSLLRMAYPSSRVGKQVRDSSRMGS